MLIDNDTAEALGAADKVDAVEAAIRSYTHNNFQARAFRFSCASDAVLLGSHPFIAVGDRVQITGSHFNDGLYDVVEVDGDSTTLDRAMFPDTANTVTKVVYPPDVVDGALSLLKWSASDAAQSLGLKSESLSRHSVTYETERTASGFPVSLMGFCKPYMKGRF